MFTVAAYCSREAGIDLELERTDIAQKKTKSGKDFWNINAKGQVPVLEIDNGQKLTEGPSYSTLRTRNLVPTLCQGPAR